MRVRAFAWFVLLSLAVGGGLVGCDAEEGVTPKCSPLPLYDITDDDAREAAEADLQTAVDENCLSPLGTAKSGASPPPAAGGSPTGDAGAAGAAAVGGAGGAGG